MTTVTARQFRATQKRFFDLAAKGETVIVRRKLDSFVIMPVVERVEDDPYFTPAMLAEIEEAVHQAKEGKVTKVNSLEDLNQFLDSL